MNSLDRHRMNQNLENVYDCVTAIMTAEALLTEHTDKAVNGEEVSCYLVHGLSKIVNIAAEAIYVSVENMQNIMG